MINLSEANKNEQIEIGADRPKIMRMSDVVLETKETFEQHQEKMARIAPEYKSSLGVRFRKGFSDSLRQMTYTPEGIKIMYGMGEMAFGDMIGSEKVVQRGKALIQTMNNEIDRAEKEAQEKGAVLSSKDLSSFGYGLGNGAGNYGVMMSLAYLTGGLSKLAGASGAVVEAATVGTGVGANFLLEATGRLNESLNRYKQKYNDPELKTLTPEYAGKNLAGNLIYATGSSILEKKMGFGQQAKIVKTPLLGHAKRILLNAASEGTTEFSQSLLNMGIDLVEGQINWKDVPEELKGSLMEGAIGSVLGGAAGTASALSHRAVAKNYLRERLGNSVPDKDLENVVDAIFESGNDSLSNIVATELKFSSELREKRGDIYNSMVTAVTQAMKESGGYSGLTEEDLAQHAVEVSNRFSDEVLAEATKRNSTIDDVIKASDIVYKDGKLHLAPTEAKKRVLAAKKNKPTSLLTFLIQHGGIKDTNGELSVLDAQKGRPGLVNNKYGLDLDRARELAEEAGYFGVVAKNNLGSTTVSDLLTLIDKELRGERVFTEESTTQQLEETKEDYSEAEAYYERYLEENGVDYEGLTFDQKKEAYEQIVPKEEIESGLEINDEGILLDEFGNELFQEQFELKEEMDAIDMHNDAYEGETININGVERTVYNSNGDRIAKSEPALRAFYNWFGDSKVVDGHGRPLVVYHGSPEKNIKVFDKSKIGRRDYGYFGQGFSFTPQDWIAEDYSKTYDENPSFSNDNLDGSVYPVYLKITNPKYTTSINEGTLETEDLKEKGYDGVILFSFNEYSESVRENDPYVKEEIEEAKKFTNEWWQLKNYDDEVVGKKFIDEIVAFEPNQIKSVDNRGTFDTSNPNIYWQGQIAVKTRHKAREVKNALQKIVDGAEEATVKDLRDDLEQYGGTNDVTFVYGDKKKGLFHIADKHGGIKTLLKVLDSVVDGDITLFEPKNKTIHLMKDGYEAVLSLDEHGKKKTWLLTGWDTKISPDAEREFNATLKATQQKPTFSRQVLGAGLNNIIITPSDTNVKSFDQIKGIKKGKPIRRGSFDAGEKVIRLFEDANTSTLPHELAHFWLDNMWTFANSGVASEIYKAQFEGVKNFLEVKPNQTYLTRQQHEKFASAYEKYVWRGEFPTPIMGVVFGNYERWLRRVYDSIADIQINGKGKVRLTPEIIKFFDSMTTGALPSYNAQIETQIRTEEAKEYDEKLTKEAREVVMKSPDPVHVYEPMKPVETTGKVKESRLYKRLKGIAGAEDSLGYNVANIAENREKAKKIWEESPEKAQAILDGKENVDDVLRQAVFTEQQRLALERGDTATYLKSLRKQSAEATRLGQELSALRGVVEDITMPSYWIRMAESESHKQLAKKMASYFDNVMGKSVLENFTAQLDADIKALQESVVSKTTTEEKNNALREGIDVLKKKYKGLKQPETTFFQTDYTNEEAAYDYIEKKAKEAIGLSLSDKDANAIIQAASDLDKLSQTLDEFGVPSEAFFVKKAELEKMVNEHTPTSRLKVLLSVVGRANMLTAPATSVLNITTNAQNYATQMALRKANNAFVGKTNDNIVDADIQKRYRNKVWRTFWNTGYDISMMQNLTDTRLYKGEDVTHSEGVGAIRQLGRWAEEYVFRKMISTPDIYFKSLKAFTEFAGNEATDIAYKEGLTGESAKKRANELFLDATRIEPATETGMAIRNKAQTDALIITFQQDTQLSESLLNLRKAINKLTGDIGIGEILSPFVKTPANILSLGMDATLGAFASPVNLFGALTDIKNGTYNTARVQHAVRQMTTFGLSHIVIALLLNALIDDDDYIPDYSQLTQTERNAVKERGASFGSVRVGDTFVSTDFFGALEMPLVAVLNARRQEGVVPVVGAYMGSIVREALDAPVIKDAITSSEALKEVGQGSLSVHEAVYDAVGDIVSSRMIPNAINTVAKISDDYERKTNGRIIDKIKARIPLLRETLEPQISIATGREIETQSAILQTLFGSRAKEERIDVVVQEFARLAEAGQGVSLSDITRSGDLKKLPDNLKPQVLREFAEKYAKKVIEKIKSDSYRRKSDEEKKEVINKVRKNIVDGIKRRYVKKLKQGRW